MRTAYQRHLAIFQENASDPNLTSVQFATLRALRDNGPSSHADRVRHRGRPATIRGIIERLNARNLIAVSQDELDRRKVIMTLLPAGKRS
jgi:DNA-binding MarR family transcriptional regulator